MPLRLRRGTNAERLTITPLEGELIYTTDSKRVYVGDGNTVGGIEMYGSGAGGGLLSENINLNSYDIEGIGNINITVGNISNGVLTLTSNSITSSTGYIAAGSGNTIGILELSTSTDLLQTRRSWPEPVEPIDVQYGLTNGFFSLLSTKNASRGTLETPLAVAPGDALTTERVFGHDGFGYVNTSAIWHVVDPYGTVSPGQVPGAIALVTQGAAQHIVSIDSNGYVGIDKFPAAATEALDVNGNGLFSGIVTASGFKGSFFADDSTTMLDGITANINGNNIIGSVVGTNLLTLSGNTISSSASFVSPFNGNTYKYLNVGAKSLSANTQIRRYWSDYLEPYDRVYGLTSGLLGLTQSKYTSRGTLESPLSTIPGDTLSSDIYYGHDGTGFIGSCGILYTVDRYLSVSSGNVPGCIEFFTGPFVPTTQIFGTGYLGVGCGFNPASEQLDVFGNAKVRGKVIVNQDTSGLPSYENYSISNGFSGSRNVNYSSRGTLTSQTVLNPGDIIASMESWGFDGTNYVPSSAILMGVDPGATISPGNVPGVIRFAVGLNDASGFNALGNFGIKTGATDPAEALDVRGNGVFSGNVNAASFKGTFVADDSTIVIDGLNGNVTASSLRVTGTSVLNNTLAIRQSNSGTPSLENYALSTGFTGARNINYTSRGSLTAPVVLNSGDIIASIESWGFEGNTYVPSSAILLGVDPNASVAPGYVPGVIRFSVSISQPASGFNSLGNFGVRTGATDPTEALDVRGNGVFTGDVTAAAFKGSFVADDSSIVVDGLTGFVNSTKVTGGAIELSGSTISTTDSSNLVISQATTFASDINVDGRVVAAEFVTTSVGSPVISSATNLTLNAGTVVEVTGAPFRLPRFTTAERDAFIAVNGDMIYNTDLEKFQGYENGAWVNLV